MGVVGYVFLGTLSITSGAYTVEYDGHDFKTLFLEKSLPGSLAFLRYL